MSIHDYPKCRKCNAPIIIQPVAVPPVRRAATTSYNIFRINVALSTGLCAKCQKDFLEEQSLYEKKKFDREDIVGSEYICI